MLGDVIWKNHPKYSRPAAIKALSPISSKRCGSNWGAMDIEVPYKSVNQFKESLPKLPFKRFGNNNGAEAYKQAGVANEWLKSGKLGDVVDQATEMLDKYKISGSNKTAIKGYIQRAKDYAARANTLWNWWLILYVPGGAPTDPNDAFLMQSLHQVDKLIDVIAIGAPHWPLNEQYYGPRGEDGKGICKGNTFPSTKTWQTDTASGLDYRTLACPHLHEVQGHRDDAILYRDLIVAAINNARCAAEAAAAVGVYEKNKAKSKSTLTIQYDPKPAKKPPVIGAPAPEAPAPEPSPIPTPPQKTKKKDNTLLIAAAAAALLILGKK